MNKKILIGITFVSILFLSINAGAFTVYDTLSFGGQAEITASSPPPAETAFTVYDTLSFGGQAEVTSPPSSSTYAKKITIDHNKINETISNFPLLVKFDTDSNLASHAQDNGWDLIFKNSDNTSTYYHEIEKFDGSTGELVAWVNVTSVSHATDTILWLHYGDGSDTDTSDSTNVWDRDRYKAVYHLNSTSDSSYIDSTLTAYNSPTLYNSGGKMGGAYLFDDSDQSYMSVSSIIDLSDQTVMTTSFWVNIVKFQDDGFDYEGGLMFGTKDGTNRAILHWVEEEGVDNNWLKAKFLLQNPSAFIMSGTDNGVNMGNEGEWHHTTCVFHQDYVILYFDGKKIVNKAGSTVAMNQLTNDTFNIGRYYETTYQYFDAYMDEVRVSNCDLSANYINATFLNMNNPSSFYTLGAEVVAEGYNAPTITNFSPTDGSSNTVRGDIIISADFSDVDGSTMNASWYWTGNWTSIGTNNSISNGTYQQTIFGKYQETIGIGVNLSDGTNWDNETFSFTVEPLSKIDVITVSNYDYQGINLSWTKNSNTSNTYIRWKKNVAPTSRTDGNLLVNSSVESYNHSSLDFGTLYYYSIWSYNVTDNVYSTEYNSGYAYTNPGNPSSLQDTYKNTNSISLQWSKGVNATNTVVYMNQTGQGHYPNRTNGVIKINNTGSSGTASDLQPGITYYFSAYSFSTTSGLWGSGNATDSDATSTGAGNITSLTVNRFNDVQLNLSWSKDTPSDRTVVLRKTGSYPTSVTDGTIVYNGSFSVYNDDGLTPATRYYYRAWAFADEEFGNGYGSDDNITRPSSPEDFVGDIINNELVITWTKGTGAARTLIRNNTGVYPTSVTDGYLVYNNTGVTTTVTGISSIDYYRGWSYVEVDGIPIYSIPSDLLWGGVEINVYKENQPHIEIGNYTVSITNPPGEAYVNTSQNNPFRIDVSDVPNGEDITIRISKNGYKSRTQIIDLDVNTYYTLTFYLAPDEAGSPPGESNEPWYIPPISEETELKTVTESVDDYTTDETVTAECTIESISAVYVYNDSIYGGWIEIGNDLYSYSLNIITISSNALDINSSSIKVQYYCDYDESYTNQYVLYVRDRIGNGIGEAVVNIARYINTSDSYQTIYNLVTDSNGQVNCDLMSNIDYYFTISHISGTYVNSSVTWSPPDYDDTKVFILDFTEVSPPGPDNPAECVEVGAEIQDNTLFVNISSICTGSFTDIQVFVYNENFTSNVTSFFGNSSVDTVLNSYSCDFTGVNNNDTFIIYIHYNHTLWSYQTVTIVIDGTNVTVDDISDEVNTLFDRLYGTNPFGWHNFIMWIILIVGMFYADQQDAGKVLVLLGGIFLFLNIVVGFNSYISTLAGGALPILMVVVGILVMWRDSNKKK